ncbi:formate dehydrogenase subunit gamma [Ovoidimarina sediminis]|uniref:formate dehydrogenase subunit gamma n=1 Tax=Ovoidimarina sediminis TaxID=3079856 RepID=UPI00290DA156|nr:formate dehydrogenase subunit gamma [Rhodophyticola sp. MJ-SS7]MDU8942049.1 formate dehydrogenase subunit gamma [Rhodophyticola sp. MJ-SS7]
MTRVLAGLFVLISAAFLSSTPALAQTSMGGPDVITTEDANSDLESILARQRGEDVPRLPRDFDSATEQAQGITSMLGVRGGASDAEVWEALRFGTADVTVSAGGAPARVLMQDRGMWWQTFRQGPLSTYGGYLLLGTLGFLALFFILRGRIRISHGRAGVTILRFNAIERFAHWLLAGSFIVLGITGLLTLFGRKGLIPLIGHEAYSTMAIASKWVHNNVAWAFMLSIIMVFLLWVVHNFPSKHDLVWFAKGGGIIGKSHPPAKKFNAGQKIIFWSVILLGGSISASGLSLLFPFELPMFAKTFAILNDFGVPGLLGMEAFPAQLAPHEEMQFAQLWHAIVSFVMMAIIIAHIYIGSVGMEGAYDAMGTGEVDLNWAKEHHSLWVEEVQAKKGSAAPGAQPAE